MLRNIIIYNVNKLGNLILIPKLQTKNIIIK